MPDYSRNIVYLSDAQRQELFENDTITVNGQTITYNDNDIYVTPQAEPITDVKINGTSIGSNGVANIPVANGSTFGVMKVSNYNGVEVRSSDGQLTVIRATDNDIKASNQAYKPITPSSQDKAVFYGLAKVAGHDEKNSSESLGTYTDGAKQAIQNMFGITGLLSTEESSTATAVHALNSTFMMNGKLHRATATIAIGDAVEVGTNCEVVKADEVFVKNTDYATSENAGVVKINPSYGLQIAANGTVIPKIADEQMLKAGNMAYYLINCGRQHIATFYGLSKAAGVDLANETVTLGTYPETSKTAIRSLIGAAAASDIPTVPVQDVKINNTSILSSGTANIPIAGIESYGVVRIPTNYAYGIGIYNGYLAIATAGAEVIKAGTEFNKTPSVARQHEATFYGLAKAAGDTTQSISTNAVGTYTDEAKLAIKDMLGITQTLTVTVLTQDNITVTGQTVTVRAANATGHIFATAAYEGQSVSFAVPSGFAYYISVSDTLDHHFNPTTASGVITDTDVSVTLTYSDFSTIQTAADIKAALNAGLDLTDLVGEQISCQWNGSTLVWDVADYSNDTITLLTHDTLPTQLVFEPVQALMWCENGLAAGSYSFIDGSSTYYFTLTTAIPSGGQLRATTSAFQTYASMEATAALETGTVSTTEISGATSLGTTASGNLNHMSRVNYGSNNYKESGLFQWLNSTEAANTPMPRITKFSRPCTYSVPGFLGALDSSFVAAIDDTNWLCSTNNTYECPTSLGGTVAKSNAYTVTAKVGLASEMEIFGSYGGTADGSAVFDLFNGATADDRKKYQPGTSTARHWWLRSPNWSSASSERVVNSSGAAVNSYAYSSSGVVPAVKISKTVVSE